MRRAALSRRGHPASASWTRGAFVFLCALLLAFLACGCPEEQPYAGADGPQSRRVADGGAHSGGPFAGITLTADGAKVFSDGTGKTLARAVREHQLSDDELHMVTLFWLLTAKAQRDGAYHPAFFASGLLEGMARLATRYPSIFRARQGGEGSSASVQSTNKALIRGPEDFKCGNSCYPAADLLKGQILSQGQKVLKALGGGTIFEKGINNANAALTGWSKGQKYTLLTVNDGLTHNDCLGILSDVAAAVGATAELLSAVATTGAAGASLASAAAVATAIAGVTAAYNAGYAVGNVINLVNDCLDFKEKHCDQDAGPPDSGPPDQRPPDQKRPPDRGTDGPRCKPPLAHCGEGYCVNLLAVSKHCGKCNNVCASGKCRQGKCLPPDAGPPDLPAPDKPVPPDQRPPDAPPPDLRPPDSTLPDLPPPDLPADQHLPDLAPPDSARADQTAVDGLSADLPPPDLAPMDLGTDGPHCIWPLAHCGGGYCVNLLAVSKHCGKCNNACASGKCVGGKCATAYCGNGVVDNGEECDGNDLGKANSLGCQYHGSVSGTLKCASDCTFDTSGCSQRLCPTGCNTHGLINYNSSVATGYWTRCDCSGCTGTAGTCTDKDCPAGCVPLKKGVYASTGNPWELVCSCPGNTVKHKYWHSNGQLESEGSYKFPNGNPKVWNYAGIAHRARCGVWTSYYDDGTKKRVADSHCLNPNPSYSTSFYLCGTVTTYHKNGQKSRVTYYSGAGRCDAYSYSTYDTSGKVIIQWTGTCPPCPGKYCSC